MLLAFLGFGRGGDLRSIAHCGGEGGLARVSDAMFSRCQKGRLYSNDRTLVPGRWILPRPQPYDVGTHRPVILQLQ